MQATGVHDYAVLLPVKPPARGKSRLDLPDPERSSLARAFALDTTETCLAAPSVGAVLVVTDDAVFATEVGALGSVAIPDGVSGDLNRSLQLAAAEATRRWPMLRPAALCGDLPALRVEDLEEALARVGALGARPSYVADEAGTGTTLYTAPYDAFTPSFGVDSARLHLDGGATAIEGALPSLRHDVDTLDDLRSARPIGLGPRTTQVMIELGLMA
jgi:2-phospho-L-lactate/phosphoenolpyruvate guanylyltransferase